IAERIWGKGAYLDTDNSLNGAIRKIRQALNDDPEAPRFIQTVTGRVYRFVAPVIEPTTSESIPEEVPQRGPEEKPAPVLPSKPYGWRWLWGGLAAAVVGMGGLLFFWSGAGQSPRLPFESVKTLRLTSTGKV